MYAELHALSNFSFLRGASQPEELIVQAKNLNYRALALTDECSMAGVVRAHVAAKAHGLALIIGARRASTKGSYALARGDLENALPGCLIIWLPRTGRMPMQEHEADGLW